MGSRYSESLGEDIYRYIMELMPHTDDLNIFLQKIYLRYNMPVIVTDIAFHLIAYGGPYPCPDPLWQTIVTSGAAEPETVVNYYFGEGFTDKMSAAGEPIDASWGINTQYPQTTCSVYLGNSIEGCCSVMYLDHGKLDFALKLNAAVKTAVEIFLGGKLRRQPMGAAPDRLVAARILLENTDAPIQLLTNTAFYKNVGLTPGYMVVAMHTDDTSGVRLQNIVNSIKVRYPQMLYVNKSDDMYLLFQNIKSDAMRENVLSDIEAEASQKAVFTCGASGVFADLKKRDAYIEQARLALEYGINHCGKNCINYFFDNFTEIILRHGCDSIFAESLIVPEFKRLIDFDEENSTDYCQSLSCYIFERCDMTKAAAKLYVHRNSLMYRIKKCEEIMDVDLSDRKTYEKLWLCCTMRSIGALPSKAE